MVLKYISIIWLFFLPGMAISQPDTTSMEIPSGGVENMSIQLYRGFVNFNVSKNKTIKIVKTVYSYDDYEEGEKVVINDNRLSNTQLQKNTISDTLYLSNKSSREIISLDIFLPSGINIVVDITHLGEIVISDMNSDLDISAFEGKIDIKNHNGSALLNLTRNGKITFDGSPSTDDIIGISLFDGDIDFSIPQHSKANFKINSELGKISNGLHIALAKGKSNRFNLKEKGKVTKVTSYWMEGELNGGGTTIMLKTVAGNVNLKDKKK